MLRARRNLMRASLLFILGVGLGLGTTACDDDGTEAPPPGDDFSFFITSTSGPDGGNFGGLTGADEFCRTKAMAAVPASASKQWRAYLSTDTVNAKDRIGTGPWFNRDGVMVAASVAALLDPAMNMINKANGLDETGAVVPGRGDTPNQHDILTGSTAEGVSSGNHCANWTSSAADVMAQVGHFDRQGGGADPMSWSSAHASQGCTAQAFVNTGGRGSIYCFAAD
jgi:Protein of unknown function (DUF1554)